MNDAFLKANITISGVEETTTQIKIKDESNKKFSFFKNKKDGNPTQAFSQFEHLKVGDRTGISYKEVPFTAKDGTQAKIKNITSFTPVFEQVGQPAQNPPKGNGSPSPTYHKEEEKDEKFWDKKAYKQCLWGYWLESIAPKDFNRNNALLETEMDLVWNVFNQIEQDATKRFATGMERARVALKPESFMDDAPIPEPVPEEMGEVEW